MLVKDSRILIENPIDQTCLQGLQQALGVGPVLILTHDNPDPDGLASGKALSCIFKRLWGISSRLVYSGIIARAENKAMLRLLTPEWEHYEILDDLEEYTALVLVDSQPGAGNNMIPNDHHPHVVFDHHHPLRAALKPVDYVDVRPEVGATSSLVFQYMQAADILPDAEIATSLFYGIQTDTRGLSRGDSPIDQFAYFELLKYIDRRLLIQVEQAGLPRDYFRAFCNGLHAALVWGRVVVCYLEKMHRPDFAAEMADLLVRLEDARAVLCLGYHEGIMYLSLRTAPLNQDAGILIQEVVYPPGKAGGHGVMAGGQIPILKSDPDDVYNRIKERFLSVMEEGGDGERLLD
jgi:nanoRNase/pAp phosphatase (c-di-AMP/oligoRNAs hydrolase)